MGETKILKFEDNEDLMESIKDFAEKNSIEHAFIKQAEGKIKDFEISAFSGRGGITNIKEKGEQEIVAISGQITSAQGNAIVQLKVSVARPGLSSVSGTLISAKACDGLEIAVEKKDVGKMIYA